MQTDTQLSAYTASYAAPVRDLAEVIDLATRHGECVFLTDNEDSRATVFHEAIDLYQQKHGINAAHVARALADWQTMTPLDA